MKSFASVRLIFGVILFLTSSFAAPSYAEDSMETRFERKLGHLFEFTQGTIASQPVVDVAIAGETEPSAPCAQTYKRLLLKARNEVQRDARIRRQLRDRSRLGGLDGVDREAQATVHRRDGADPAVSRTVIRRMPTCSRRS